MENIRSKAIEWWNGLKVFSEKCAILNRNGFDQKRQIASLTGREIENLYLSEHKESVVDGLEDAAKDFSSSYQHIFIAGANWKKEQLSAIIEELDKMKRSFYMDICRAYNAGKGNALKMVAQAKEMGEDTGVFISSHEYFKSEFPEFETNVP